MTDLRRTLLNIFFATIVAVLFSVLTVRLTTVPQANQQSSGGLAQSVVKRGEIRAAYYVGAPFFMKDPNTGKVSGIFADITEEACANLGLKMRWTEEVGFGEMIEGLKTNRFDLVASGVWINSSRGREADFTVPVLYDAVCVFVREDDHRFDKNLAALNDPGVRLSTIDGEMASLIAKTDFPKAKTESLPQSTDFTQMILNVVNKKADATFLGVAPALKFQAANPGTIRNITPDQPVRIFPTAIMLKQGEYQFKRMFDSVLMEMINNGRVEAIIRKYEEHPGSHYRVAPGFVRKAG